MKLTKQKAIKLHREMWKRISEMTDEEIEECGYDIGIIKNKTINDIIVGYNICIHLSCFCCEYRYSKNLSCSECLLQWPGKFCCSELSPYYKIRDCLLAYDLNKFRGLAKQISELPERED